MRAYEGANIYSLFNFGRERLSQCCDIRVVWIVVGQLICNFLRMFKLAGVAQDCRKSPADVVIGGRTLVCIIEQTQCLVLLPK